MKIYVFGNQDVEMDKIAIETANVLQKIFTQIQFVFQNPIEDFAPSERDFIILDTAIGIKKPVLLDDITKIEKTPTVGMHDFDLGFTLKLLFKIGKIDNVKIIAIPADYQLSKSVEEISAIIKKISS